jgi:hypothetical protein
MLVDLDHRVCHFCVSFRCSQVSEVLLLLLRDSKSVCTTYQIPRLTLLTIHSCLELSAFQRNCHGLSLAAFGLSAFVFSIIGAFGLRDDTSKLLLLLASGTVLLPVISFPFLNVYQQPLYDRLSSRDLPGRSDSQPLHRTSSADGRRRRFSDEIGAQSTTSIPFLGDSEEDLKGQAEDDKPHISSRESHEGSSLISKASASGSGHHSPQKSIDLPDTDHCAPHLDIRGFALLPHAEFWQLFLMLGLMTGIGLMTIK